MAQAQAAGTASGLLQNKAVLIGGGIGAVVLIGVVVFLLIPKGEPTPSTPPPTTLLGGTPGGDGSASNAGGGTVPSPVDAAGSFNLSAGSAGAGAAGNGPAMAAVPMQRTNPFLPNSEMRRIIADIPLTTVRDALAPQQDIYYGELHTPKPPTSVTEGGEDEGAPAIPAMRVSAIILGSPTSALLQIDSEFVQATPGRMVPRDDGPYRVERIESSRVILSRRWESGSRKGVQTIEVPLGEGIRRSGGGGPGGGFGGLNGPAAAGAGAGSGTPR